MFGLDDAPNGGHLRKDAVFESGDEALDFLRSGLCLAHSQGTSPTQGLKRGLEPLQRSRVVSFEQFYSLTVNPRKPKQAIRLVRLKTTRSLPTLERPRRNEEDFSEDLHRQGHEPKNLEQRAEGESLLDLLVEGRSVERPQAKQDDVGVGASGPTDGLEVGLNLWSARSLR